MEKGQQGDCVECGRFCFDNQHVFDPQRLHGKKPGALRVFLGHVGYNIGVEKAGRKLLFNQYFFPRQGRVEEWSRKSRGRVEEWSRICKGLIKKG